MVVYLLPIVSLLFTSLSLNFDPDQLLTAETQLIDDFEADEHGALPSRWKYIEDRQLVWVESKHMRPDEEFFVVEEDGNKFLRAYTEGEAVHLTMANEEDGFDWDIREHPYLGWDWRAQKLPDGAREDNPRLNDVGVGLYVFFDFRGLLVKRPVGIKYTYSSTLPVGTVLKQDKLRVIVATNGQDEYGQWKRIERNVLEDYRQVFGEDPPDRPLMIRLWSDSDNTNQSAEGDFDNIELFRKMP